MRSKIICSFLKFLPLYVACLLFQTAFAEDFLVKDSVLHISSSRKEIAEMEFAGRLDFHTVDIPDNSNLSSIGDYAFFGCRNLKNFIIPHSVSNLGTGAFQDCGLVSLVIPGSITTIPRYMCAWNENLKSVSLPEAITDIGSHAFAYCSSLKEINIPDNVAHIGSNLFSRCCSLVEIRFPDSVTELESYALSDCCSLLHATLPANNNMIGEYIFSGCTSLLSITCLSPTPPISDCNSPLTDDADPDFYTRVALKTLPDARSLFETSPLWNPLMSNDKTR